VAFEEGWYVHQQIIPSGLESDVFVGNTLVDMHVNVGALRILQKCSTRCHLKMWSLGMPYLKDVDGHGKEASSHIWNGCVKKVSNQMISFLLVFCQLVAMQVW
jgi:hypothetical protein